MTVCPLHHANNPARQRHTPDGYTVCIGHAKSLPDRLRNLASLWQQLGHILNTTPTHGEKVSGTVQHGLQLNLAVVELRHDIRVHLAGWVNVVCDERSLTPPCTDDADTLAHHLATHADWLTRQDFITDLWADLILDPAARARDATHNERERAAAQREQRPARLADSRALTTRANSQLQPSNRRTTDVTDCLNEDCGGTLVAVIRDTDELLPTTITCDRCGQAWPPESWMTLGRRLRASA